MKKIIITILIVPFIILAQVKDKLLNSNDFKIINKFQIDSTITHIIFNDNKFIAYSNFEISCFDNESKLIWKNHLRDSLISNVNYVDNNLVFINSKFDLVSISAENGKTIQSLGLDIYSKAFICSFDFKNNNESISLDNSDFQKALLLIFENGTLLCLDLNSFQEYWRKTYEDTFTSLPLILKNKFLIFSKSGYINYFDLNNGLLLWKWKETKNFQFNTNSILNNDKSVYLINDENSLYSINLILGKLNWKYDKQKILNLLFLSDDGKFIYAQNENNNIMQISLLDGKLRNEFKSNELKSIVSYVFIYKGQYFFVANDKLFKFYNNKINQVFKNDFPFEKLIYTDNSQIILSDIKNNILILK